ncbi:hypothetical protein MMC34_000085 [Xylographa carneopallida]|nr:hypothetical protein [Xylographa carneopallida]
MSDDSSSSSSESHEEEEEKEIKSGPSRDVKSAKNGEQSKKKKKKNAPDRPQPAWLFPPDAENPVLNPKSLSEEEKRKAYEERMEAIRFLKHKSVSAPMKTAPPSQLLTLIGAFFASYGFNSTGRLFTLERNARKKLDGWNDEVGAKLEKGMPDLVKIFKDWSKEWHERRELDMTSSEEDDDAITKRAKMVKKRAKLEKEKTVEVDETSSSGSDQSEAATKKVPQAKIAKKTHVKVLSSGSSASSTSDSDADDDKDITTETTAQNPTVVAMVNNLKRKIPSSTAQPFASTSDSNSDTSSSDGPQQKKKKTVSKPSIKVPVSTSASTKATKPRKDSKAKKLDIKSSSSSSEATSESDSDHPTINGVAPKTSTPAATLEPPLMNGRTSSTDSSSTLNNSSSASNSKSHNNVATSSSVSSTSDSEAPAPTPKKKTAATKPTKRKRSPSPKPSTTTIASAKVPKKTNTPFSRIPQDTKVDPKLASNAYVPYDYAEKAHQDLVVTKGKGFTKEKNKKKKGA